MELQDILSVGLTPQDFEILMEGIDAIPEKGLAGEIMGELTSMMLAAKGPNDKMEKYRADMINRARGIQRKAEERKEDLAILKAKVILLKRLITTNAAIKQANDIVNKSSHGA